MIKILNTADFHANSNYENFKKSYEQIVDYVVNNDINAVLIAGDIFDSRIFAGKQYTNILEDIRLLACYCSVLIVQGTPSHDFANSFSPFEKGLIKTDYPVHIINNHWFDNDTTVYYIDDVPDTPNPDPTKRTLHLQQRKVVQNTELFASYYKSGDLKNKKNLCTIQGLAWVSKNRWLTDNEIKNLHTNQQNELFVQRTDEYFVETKKFNTMFPYPSIWMGHLQLENILFSKGQDISSDSHPMRWVQGLADKVVLGHIHKADDLYCGSIYNKTWGEMEEKSFRVISIEDNKILSDERIKIDTPMMIKVQCDMDEYKKIKKTNMVDDVSVTGNKVWLRITVGNKKTINVEKELEHWKDICDMRLEVETIKTEAVQRLSDYDKSMGLVDKFKLFCKQKGTEASEFQISKLIELEENK